MFGMRKYRTMFNDKFSRSDKDHKCDRQTDTHTNKYAIAYIPFITADITEKPRVNAL